MEQDFIVLFYERTPLSNAYHAFNKMKRLGLEQCGTPLTVTQLQNPHSLDGRRHEISFRFT
jgi:hypothetical protein